MMKILALFALLTGVLAAQTAPPPALLPNLPANLSQKLVMSSSVVCAATCTVSGSGYYLVTLGSSGGIHYDAAGNLLIAIPPSGNLTTQISEIAKMAADGTASPLISFPPTPTSGCMVISNSSLIERGEEYMQQPFSLNPALTSLFVVTVNTLKVISWDPTTSTGMCVGHSYQVTGGGTTPTYLNTYALIELSGSGL